MVTIVCRVEIRTRRPASADRTARRQFQATGQPVSRTQASDAMTSRLPRYKAKCVQRRCFQSGSVPLRSDIKGTELPPANILIPLERQLIDCRWQFLYNETLQQTFRPLLSKLSKRRQICVIYPHFEEISGGVEPWLMAGWKACVEFVLSVIVYFFFYLLRLRRYKAKHVKTRCLQEGVGHLEPRFQGEVVAACQYMDTTRKAIDCATTLPLTVFI